MLDAKSSVSASIQRDAVLGTLANDPVKKVGILSLLAISFFWVSGGNYGNEPLFQSAPALYVAVGIIVIPFLFALPEALMTAELATAIPEDGGVVVWVQEACGGVLGAHNTYWNWVTLIVDASVYPVLLSDYIGEIVELSFVQKNLISVFVVLVLMAIKLLGIGVLVKFNSVLVLLCLIPFVIFVCYAIPYQEPSNWVEYEGDVDWPLFLSLLLWLYSGFFTLGALAGEVRRPRRTFSATVSILLPLLIVVNLLPTMMAIGINNSQEEYKPGFFSTLAGNVAGHWLKIVFIIGSNISLIGLFNSQSMAAERMMLFFLEKNLPSWVATGHQYAALRNASGGIVISEDGPSSWWGNVVLHLRIFLWDSSSTGISRVYIVLNSMCCCVLVWLPYDILVEFEMLLSGVVTIIFLYAFLYLRWVRWDLQRDFKVPGNFAVAVLLTVPVLILSLLNMGFILYTDTILDKDPLNVFAFVITIAFGVCVNVYFRCFKSWLEYWRGVERGDDQEKLGLRTKT